MIKLVIFDLDGTLLDTITDIANACNHALAQCGCPERQLCEYNRLVGRGIFNLFKGALPEDKRNEDMVRMMHNHFIPYYNTHKADMTRPYEGICRMMDSLAENGIALAVASNKYQQGTEELVKRFFGRYSFHKILGQREGYPIKPDPYIIKEAAEGIEGIGTDGIVYCGDSDVDMQTGINAGVRTIGVTWGFRSREELSSYSPWILADSPQDISDAILKENEIKS